MYYRGFEDKTDICREFEISGFEGHVLWATYDQECYEGSAEVIYLNDGKLYQVSGSHCSCFGLENQWKPEETTVATLLHMIREGRGSVMNGDTKLEHALEYIESMITEKAPDDQVLAMLKLIA